MGFKNCELRIKPNHKKQITNPQSPSPSKNKYKTNIYNY